MADNRFIRQVADRPPGGQHSARRVSRVAEIVDAKSYLEIGVFRGNTFNCLNFDRKVAVDPKFAFDIEAFKEDGVSFREVTSDEFFIENGTKELFDIIFLDGLHTFTQTFKDFCNSLVCSHDRTVWVIDDVVPYDVYSSWPDANQARGLRHQETGNNSGMWHGDVYKMLCAIHDFFPALSYAIITDRGNQQMLIWKTPRESYAPILDSLEAVDRLNYFDFVAHKPQLNHATEDEAMKALAAGFEGRYGIPAEVAKPVAVAS